MNTYLPEPSMSFEKLRFYESRTYHVANMLGSCPGTTFFEYMSGVSEGLQVLFVIHRRARGVSDSRGTFQNLLCPSRSLIFPDENRYRITSIFPWGPLPDPVLLMSGTNRKADRPCIICGLLDVGRA